MVKRFVWPLLLCLSGTPFSSLAQEPAPVSTGKEEFDRATELFAAEEFAAALPYFQQAYERSGRRPSTIIALAQCERALGKYDEALVHLREYLASDPSPSDAEAAEQTISIVEELRRARPKPRGPEAAPMFAPSEPPPSEAPAATITAPPPITARGEGLHVPTWAWWTAGLGAAALTSGVAFGVAATSDAADGAPDEASSKATVANVSFVIAAVSVIATGVGIALTGLGDAEGDEQ